MSQLAHVERPDRPIIVNCPSFDENSGGAIVLHALVDRLRKLGVEAYAVKILKKDYAEVDAHWLRALKRWNIRRKQTRFKTHPSMDVPVAPKERIGEGIIVYPETVSGNPLGASRVVRWLLNRPGYLGIDSKIASSDEVFFYQKVFAQDIQGIPDTRLLQLRWLREDIYSDLGLPRSGSCRMIRKGTNTAGQVPQPDPAILLDGKSHAEIAEVFNRTEIFYCHDPYTMYAYYAALCGCIPVVIPQPNLSAKDWRAGFELKKGVAYGEEEIDWARSTRDDLIADMRAATERENETVIRFLATLKARFG
ncbi:hypothetical protein QKW60_08420 [Defluviimonas aestuarii]|uniref:hypothetical protein n=1 Tax=Albidovulum aestuarii TaxID=1130726 RepID=UPI00249A5BDF|nr:hypothetical protein [Defluviimonas aestuarii]MDI3336426.1 hypothetical protein [Defluviimonas aestuarii]